MQQLGQRTQWGGTAALWGGVTGLVVALVILASRLVGGEGRARVALAGAQAGPFWLRALIVLLAAVAFVLAGLFAARRTRAVEAGIVAGLLAGAVTGTTVALLTLVNAEGATGRLALRAPRAAAVVGGLVLGVLELLVVTLVGTGLGALGGLLGCGRYRPASQSPYGLPPTYPGNPVSQGQGWPPVVSVSAPEDSDTVVRATQVYPSSANVSASEAPPTY